MDELYEIFLANFLDPKKRIFVGYLLSAILIAMTWLVLRKKVSLYGALARIFDPSILLSRSSLADVKVFFLNKVFMLFISPLLITQLIIATAIFNALSSLDWNPAKFGSHFAVTTVIASFTTFLFLFEDFSKYIVHRWMHKLPFLWAFHKVHHSAEKLTPLTVFRTHPVEGVVFSFRSAFVQGISISFFYYLFGNKVDLATILGVNVFLFFFNALGSNLRHSHISIRYWTWLERFLISPAQHQLHHSIAEEHYDKNFGASLAVWDWMFGSLHLSIEKDDFQLGVKETDEYDSHSLKAIYVAPLFEAIKHLKFMLIGNNQSDAGGVSEIDPKMLQDVRKEG